LTRKKLRRRPIQDNFSLVERYHPVGQGSLFHKMGNINDRQAFTVQLPQQIHDLRADGETAMIGSNGDAHDSYLQFVQTGFQLGSNPRRALAIAIGFGRAYIGPLGGFETRYITLSAPLLLLLFFLYEVYGSPALKRHVPRTLFALMSILFVINTQKGISYSTNLWKHVGKFEQDMRDGVPAEALGVRYADQWGHAARELISTRLVWLQTARLGLYRSSAYRSGQAVRVECISAEEPATENIEPVRLAPGQSFAQLFSVQEDGELRRIDVQVHIGREGRSLKRLDWTLFKIAPDGKQNLLAADSPFILMIGMMLTFMGLFTAYAGSIKSGRNRPCTTESHR